MLLILVVDTCCWYLWSGLQNGVPRPNFQWGGGARAPSAPPGYTLKLWIMLGLEFLSDRALNFGDKMSGDQDSFTWFGKGFRSNWTWHHWHHLRCTLKAQLVHLIANGGRHWCHLNVANDAIYILPDMPLMAMWRSGSPFTAHGANGGQWCHY